MVGLLVATGVGVAGSPQAMVPCATTVPPTVSVTTLPVPGVLVIGPVMTVMPACTTELLKLWVPSVVEILSVATPPSGEPAERATDAAPSQGEC